MLPAFEKVVPPPGRSLAWDTFDLAAFPYRWHFHPEFELTLITAGRGRRFVGDSIEPFEPGDLVLLGPHLPHTWHSMPARGERSSAVVVRFGPDVLGAGFLERAECGRLRRLMAAAGRGFVFSGRAAREAGDRMVGLAAAAPLERLLALPALLISVVGFVESVSVGQTLAARRRQRIEPDRELVALGASKLGAAVTGGFPVTGGFARSVVNFDAGAQTPAAGVFTAGGILLAALLLTPALYFVPQATLAATIVVAVLSLVDLSILRRTWVYAKTDFAAVVVTLLVTLGVGVESGLVAGVLVSLALFLFKTSRPHIAEVGLVAGTEHFRNVLRHRVSVNPALLSLRVDESLYFANARALEDRINEAVAQQPELQHVILQCSAINDIDASALESLEAIDHRLRDAGIVLHLSEVKGPVMDRLQATDFIAHLRGQVFLTHFQAIAQLAPQWLASVVGSSAGLQPSMAQRASP